MVVIQLLLAESFPTEIRSYASGITSTATSLNMFGATKLFPELLSVLGFHGAFWMYSGVLFLALVYGAISIPENKGQSLVKTEDKFQVENKIQNKSASRVEEGQNNMGFSSDG